jgi:hypothetical protein
MEQAFLSDIRPFVRGGLPGLARLKEVLGSITKHHRVPLHRRRALLIAAGLRPYTSIDRQKVSFYLETPAPDTTMEESTRAADEIS